MKKLQGICAIKIHARFLKQVSRRKVMIAAIIYIFLRPLGQVGVHDEPL
jgi:hypothetical protein